MLQPSNMWPILKLRIRGAWVAQSVEHPTGSGHDLTVREFEPRVGLCADSSEPGACFGFCVSLSLCPFPAHTPSLSVSVFLSLSLSPSKIYRH